MLAGYPIGNAASATKAAVQYVQAGWKGMVSLR